MDNNLNRREFVKAVSLGAAGVGALTLSSCREHLAFTKPISGMGLRIGSSLRVKPALLYQFHKRREAWSWRPWGGLHNQDDVDTETRRIERELERLKSAADFPMEVLPLAPVSSSEQAAAVKDSHCDVLLVYAAGGNQGWLETLAASKKPNVMFLRHESGPVYLWYEIAHPRFLRKNTDRYKEPGMDVWDIVVDDYEEVLWRLRALYGLKNTIGARIVAIGDAGGWGEGHKLGPATAREIWKLDIRPVAYKELEPMIKKRPGSRRASSAPDRRIPRPKRRVFAYRQEVHGERFSVDTCLQGADEARRRSRHYGPPLYGHDYPHGSDDGLHAFEFHQRRRVDGILRVRFRGDSVGDSAALHLRQAGLSAKSEFSAQGHYHARSLHCPEANERQRLRAGTNPYAL